MSDVAAKAAGGGSLLAGFVSTLALTSALGLMGGTAGSPAPAAFLGIFFAVFAATGARVVRDVVAGVCGAVGSVAAFIDLDQAAQCAGANVPLTLAWGVAILVIAAFAALHALLLKGRRIALTPLALFGALEVLSFFVLPFGVSLDQTANTGLALLVSLGAALLLGALVGYRPDWALGVFGVLIGIAMLGVTSAIGTACASGMNLWGIGAAATYLVLYGVTRLITRRMGGR